MAKSFLILLSILFAVNVIMASYVRPYEREFKRLAPYVARDGNTIFYYVSMTAAEHPTAARNCREFFGENATLLSINTVEEYNYLKEYLEEYGGGSKLWTSGIYDGSEWRWSETNEIVPSFIEWVPGVPGTSPAHRLGLFHLNRYSAKLFSAAQTVLYGYVCKLEKVKKPGCFETNDLLVLLDASSSIGSYDFEKSKFFVEKLMSSFTAHQPSRVAFITFSRYTSTIFNLTNTFTPKEISNRIMDAEYLRGSTATDLALREAMRLIKATTREFPRNVVVLTDGLSDNPRATVKAAKELMNMNVNTYSVGIGHRIDHEELMQITGGDDTRVFTVERMDDLMELLHPLTEKVCSA